MRLEFFGIDELNFVEFNITGDDLNCQRLQQESRYINSDIFNLFASCFENSNELYEYFEPTKYNSRKIVVLRNELLQHLKKLEDIKSSSDFTDYIDNIFLGKVFLMELEKIDSDWKNQWSYYQNQLKGINNEMISIVDKCIEESRILWIIGY